MERPSGSDEERLRRHLPLGRQGGYSWDANYGREHYAPVEPTLAEFAEENRMTLTWSSARGNSEPHYELAWTNAYGQLCYLYLNMGAQRLQVHMLRWGIDRLLGQRHWDTLEVDANAAQHLPAILEDARQWADTPLAG